MNLGSLKLKLAVTLTVMTVAVNLIPAKAQAAVIIGFATNSWIAEDVGFFGGGAAILVGDSKGNRKLVTYGLIAAVLDADGSVSQSEAVRSFTNRFPEIDNIDVANNFAILLHSKFIAIHEMNPHATAWKVSFSEEETMSFLAPVVGADVTPEQAAKIVAELK